MMPRKKKRKQELCDGDKLYNKFIGSQRVVVEHAIGGAKRFSIIKYKYRSSMKNGDDSIMMVACGLHNFLTEKRK